MRLPIVILLACHFFRENNAFTTTRSPERNRKTMSTTVDSPSSPGSIRNSTVVQHQQAPTIIATTTTTPTSLEKQQITTVATTKTTTTHPTPALPHPGDCDFDKSWCNWINQEDDDFDWVRNKGRTTSSGTGPEHDVNGNGYYVYIEASWPRRPNQMARLSSPVLNGTQCMRFQYNMHGRYMGFLQIYVKEGKSMQIFLWGRYKNKGVGWHSSNVTVYGVDYKVLLVGGVGKTYMSDIAIDGITFVDGTCDGKPLFSQFAVQRLGDFSTGRQEGETGSCNFDRGYCDWIDVPVGDDFDWKLQRGKTGTKDTGPLWDHTGLNGYYLYIESSSPRKIGDVAQLLSPRLCGTMCLRMYYHLYGSHVGRLTIYQRYGMGNDDRIWGASGDHGDGWHEVVIEISGNCYQIVIEGETGNGYLGDAAIDDIIFNKGTCCSYRNRHSDITKGNCSFNKGYCQWKNEAQRDDFDWSLLDKGTPSETTGPDGPYSGTGQYAFVESSEPRLSGQKAILVGPVLSGFVCFSFKYHMFGKDIGSLAVFKHGSGVHRKLLWHRNGNMGNLWRNAAINIHCREPSFQIEFEAVVKGWRSDIAIDDISFSKKKCKKIVDAPIILDPVIPTTRPSSNGDCTFPNTFCEWKNDNDDGFDWEIGSRDTPTLETGPKSDVDGNGFYIFIEASSHRYWQKASLSSGYMRGRKCMTFHYHMFGKGTGVLSIQLIDVNNNYKHTVWYKGGNKGPHWIRAHLNIEKDQYKIAIVAQRRLQTGDIAVDDISFQDGRCVDTKETVLDNLLPRQIKPTVPFEERPEDCTFEDNNMCKWVNLANDNFDWKLWKGNTPSRNTGPSSGHGGKGMYIYTEASSPSKQDDTARISLTRSASTSCMRFYYYMYGENVNTITLTIVWPSKQNTLWLKRGPQDNQWLEANLAITSREEYQLVFEAVIGSSFQGDIALDDITFTDGLCDKPTLPSQSSLDSSSTPSSASIQGDCPNCAKAKT